MSLSRHEGQPVCLIVQPIHAAGLELLTAAGIRPLALPDSNAATVLAAVGEADAVITRNNGLSAESIAAAPRLRVIAMHGVGTDAVATEVATERGVVVVNTPHVNAQSVAEHVLALTFALAKAIVPADTATRNGDLAFKYRVTLTELHQSTIGIVGFGAIGQATARLARALGMRVLVQSRNQSDDVLASAGAERAADLDALLRASDVVSLHVPLNASTRGLIGARELAAMKPTAFLINTARGGVVDEAALAAALAQGRIAGAGLDVFSTEPLPTTSALAGLANVVLTPHLAGSTVQAMQRMAGAAASQVVDVLSGRRPRHLVNPAVWPPPAVERAASARTA